VWNRIFNNPLGRKLPQLSVGQRVRLHLERAPVYDHPGYVERMRETTKVVEVVEVISVNEAFVKDVVHTLKYAGSKTKHARRFTWHGDQLVSTQKPPLRYLVLDVETL